MRRRSGSHPSGRLGGLLSAAAWVAAGSVAHGQQVVGTVAELEAAIARANDGTGDPTVLLRDGVYSLESPFGLVISGDGITVRGESGDPGAVILQGRGMTDPAVSHVFQIGADLVTIEDMTLRLVRNHAVQVHGELPYDADGTVLRNLRIQDTGEQMVKVSYRAGQASFCEDGLVEGCRFEYTAGVGPQFYIGGIDAHAARNWIVRGNTFVSIRSPGPGVAEHAIHFWSDSEGTVCERNRILDCDRGIGFGLGDRGHRGGIIRNNMIYHGDLGGADHGDVGIELESAPDAKVYHNTIYQEHTYPAAISVRWTRSTNVHVANNLILMAGSTGQGIWARDGGQVLQDHNYVGSLQDWLVDPAGGDLHLKAGPIAPVLDQGAVSPDVPEDFDGEARPQGEGADLGADERGAATGPRSSSWGSLKGRYRG